MASLPKITLPNIQNGIIRPQAVDETLVPQNTCRFAQNVHFDEIGAVKLRKGLTLVKAQVESGSPILGMANYIDNLRTTFRLIAKINTKVYSYNGTTWSEARAGISASSKARFTNFIDLTYMVNGNGGDALQTYGGTTFGTSNVADLPKGDFIENYRSRVWVADSSTDKVYYSDVVTTSNTLTGGTSFIQVSPQDGERITALKRHPRALLVFKNNHIYKIYSPLSSDPDPSILRGTYSQESVIESKAGMFYHHPTAFYQLNFDGPQIEISRPIIDVIEAIPRSYYESVSGWEDGDHLYWSIGDITLEGLSFSNMVCRYTLSTQVWTLYSYGSEIRTGGKYDDGTTIIDVVGDDDGNVLELNKGTTDNTKEIHFDLQTHFYYLTNIKSQSKSINEISLLHENAEGAQLQWQQDDDAPNKWRDIGSLKKSVYETFHFKGNDFVKIRFRIFGSSVGSPFTLRVIELLSNFSDDVIKKYG